jgi:hypothetical protein
LTSARDYYDVPCKSIIIEEWIPHRHGHREKIEIPESIETNFDVFKFANDVDAATSYFKKHELTVALPRVALII